MAEPFLGEIRVMSFPIVPRGWAQCNGQLMAITQNQALYSLLGVMYGGDGRTTFGLPNLQGRAPLHFGTGFPQGQMIGEEAHALTVQEMPAHSHRIMASANTADQTYPAGNLWAKGGSAAAFAAQPNATMDPASVASTGNNLGHENRSPFLTLNFIIALTGMFPPRN